MNMLDIEVSKSHGFGRTRLLDLAIYVKPTFLGAPLHHTSVHPYSVHVSWPCSRLHNFLKTCSDRGLYRIASENFLKRFFRYHQHPNVCERLLSLHAKLLCSNSTGPSKSRPARENSWLAIPFHPALARPGFGSREKCAAGFYR